MDWFLYTIEISAMKELILEVKFDDDPKIFSFSHCYNW